MRKGAANGMIIVLSREFEVPSEWYYVVRNSEFGEITFGVTSEK
jgi:hypothetical protein